MTPEQVHEELQSAAREWRVELRELRADFKELRSEFKELRADVKEQFQRVKLLIWLPVATGLIQIIVAIITHKP